MFFQGRGTSYLAERSASAITGPYVAVCQDALSVALATDSFEHLNKCGPIDTPDFRGSKGNTGTVTFSYADVENKKFAIGTLGTVNAAAGGTTPETGEELPIVADDDVYFLGGLEHHRSITALTITDSDSSPASLVADSDFTLDAVTGKVTFLDVSGFTQPFIAAYTHQDPASVSILSAAQKEYFLRFENINKANANDPGSFELYRVRFDPAALLDFLSDELQILELTGTVLADTDKSVTDTVFGQFGRRIL